MVEIITFESDWENIILEEHTKAHRNERENGVQIVTKYYFPPMTQNIKRIPSLCSNSKDKYERHSNTPEHISQNMSLKSALFRTLIFGHG